MSKAQHSFRTVYCSLWDDGADDVVVREKQRAQPDAVTADADNDADAGVAAPAGGGAASALSQRYEKRSVLGRGGMGQVWLCRDKHIGRDVAIKVVNAKLARKTDARLRFLREARVQGRLEHPAIVPVYDLEDDDGAAYFAMKRVRGVTLASILDKKKSGDPAVRAEWEARFPLRKLVAALGSVALAVDFAHSRGVAHRDIKPGNIMLGDFGEVYLLDWGVAKILDDKVDDDDDGVACVGAHNNSHGGTLTRGAQPRSTELGTALGTPGYMAPEQIDGSIGDVGVGSDVYALGAVLFEMVALRPYIDARDTLDATLKTLQGVEPRPSIIVAARAAVDDTGAAAGKTDLDDICARALARNPVDRFATARELHDALDRYLAGEADLERRRALSQRHLEAARARMAGNERNVVGIVRAESVGAEVDHQRSAALRDLGSALALDPDNVEARRALVALLTSAPSQVPPEVARKVEEDERERAVSIARMRARRSAIVWLPFLPVSLMLGVRDARVFSVVVAALLLSTAMNVCLIHIKKPPVWLPYVAHLAFFTAVLAISFIAGPFIFLPPLLLAYSVEYQLHPKRVHRVLALAGASALFVAAFALQLTGAVAPSYSVVDGGILIHSRLIDLGPGVMWFFFAGSLATIVAPSFLAARARAVLAAAEKRLHLQAWQLAQIVPERAESRAESRTPYGSHQH